ncbi:MAG: transcription termination factor NusA [Candidatus Oxydemutatoraceae bacterium WSBS_2016_MAG_OTU14]
MNYKELLLAIDVACNEKGLNKEEMYGALESALAVAYRRKVGGSMEARIKMDRETGECTVYRCWQVIDDEDPLFESPEHQILFEQAKKVNPDIQVGEFIEEELDESLFQRISVHTAKQVIVGKIREAERAHIVNKYRSRVGDLLMSVVKREDYSGVYVDLGDNAEGYIPREQMILRENFRPGDRIRSYLLRIDEGDRGSQIILSRTAPQLLMELFKLEVPEVGQGIIEIMGAVRDPGFRAKISVRSNDPRLDPVGACVGMRGARVQSVSNELAGERIDIIPWHENPAQHVINAMAPATITSIVIDEDSHSMEIAVEEEKLSQAIGRGGQNIRLASKLVDWKLDVMSENQADEKSEKEIKSIQQLFIEKLDVDEEIAKILVHENIMSLDDIVYGDEADLVGIEEFDQAMVEALRQRASDALLSMAMSGDLNDADNGVNNVDLKNLEGIDIHTIELLAEKGIKTIQELADQSTADLLEIEGMDQTRAAALIMEARAPLFEQEEEKLKEAQQSK